MTDRFRKRLTAWLGLIAMWLIVFAPIVSQLAESARSHQQDAVAHADMRMGDMHMGGMQMAGMQMAGMHMGDAHSDHHASKSTLAACGYCDLLASHAVMPVAAPVPERVIMLVMIAEAPVLSVRFTPIGAFPSGRPRAPPVVS